MRCSGQSSTLPSRPCRRRPSQCPPGCDTRHASVEAHSWLQRIGADLPETGHVGLGFSVARPAATRPSSRTSTDASPTPSLNAQPATSNDGPTVIVDPGISRKASAGVVHARDDRAEPQREQQESLAPMVDVEHLRRRQRTDLLAQTVVATQQIAEIDIVRCDRQTTPARRLCIPPLAQQPPQRQLRRAPMLAIERMVEHRDVRIVQCKAQLRTQLEVARHQARAWRHRRQPIAHGIGKRHPTRRNWSGGNCAMPSARASRHRRDDVIAEHCRKPQSRSDPGGDPPATRPSREHHRHQRQQREVAGQRPVEAHPLAIGEEAQRRGTRARSSDPPSAR